MALHAGFVHHLPQVLRANVLHVTRTATRREGLKLLVRRRAMAAQAGFVGDMLAESNANGSGLEHRLVAAFAALPGKGVNQRKRPAYVRCCIPACRICEQPGPRKQRDRDHQRRSDETPARPALEVVQVVALS